ncbi:DUF3100 domain-containing protein [Clostridium sp.]|uniref:DUF3100 domain-containing protein n=1 Tax=Clostridium sp. TaxID=1506 RepID=UPI001A4821CE|nr:DUF3100 domain-containing protein [Clostridium sp.]MBK5242307.1 DUF3100 domain-containing protein [Clostridium sp.]
MKNWKLHMIALTIVVIAEMIGTYKFRLGPGVIVILPMLYALILGVVVGPKYLKIAKEKEVNDASGLITISLMLLMARYGTLIGPTLPKIIQSSPALILQEFGNIATILIAVPLAVYLGLKRETIGAAHSICREPNIALIGDVYGLNGPEGRGVMGVYISGTVIGTVFFGLFASLLASFTPLHPYALAMASGVGSASMMTAAVGTLTEMYPKMKDTLAAYGAASNMLSGLDGVFMSLWIALPFTEWLYRKCYKVKYGTNAPITNAKGE